MQSLIARVRADNNLKDLLKNSGMLYASGLIALGLTFAQQFSTAALLGSSKYGQFAIIMSSSLVFTILLDFRTWEIGSKLMTQPAQNDDRSESVRIITWLTAIEIGAGIAGTFFMVITANLAAKYLLDDVRYTGLIALYALNIPFRLIGSGILSVLPRFYDRFNWLAIKAVVYALLRLVLITGAALSGFGLAGVIMAALVAEILHIVLILGMTWRIWRIHLQGAPLVDFTRPKELNQVRHMLPELWINSTILGLQLYFFVPVAALFTTPEQIGVFRVGLDVMELLDKTVQPLWVVFSARIIMLFTPQTMGEFRRFLRQCAAVNIGVVVPTALMLCAISLVVMPMLPKYEGVAQITVMLLLSDIFYIGLIWTRPVIITTRLITAHNKLIVVLLIISFILLIMFVPGSGSVGIALAKSFFLVSAGVLSLVLLKSRTDL